MGCLHMLTIYQLVIWIWPIHSTTIYNPNTETEKGMERALTVVGRQHLGIQGWVTFSVSNRSFFSASPIFL